MKMNVVIAVAAAVVVGFSQPSVVTGEIDISAEACGGKMFGQTKYHISFTEWVYRIGYVTGESLLEFPLDAYMTGINVAVCGQLEEKKTWSVNLGVQKNLNNPSGAMKDSDWIILPDYYISWKASYTESDAELDALIAGISARIRILTNPKFKLDNTLGYRYQSFSYEIIGIKGYDSEYQDVNVLDYKVSYHVPYIGFIAHLDGSSFGLPTHVDKSSPLSLDAELSFSPATVAKDRDDHILRNKLVEGSSKGTSLLAGLKASWALSPPTSQRSWSIGLRAEFVSINTKGHQDQRWYGDDPVSEEEDDTGLVFSGIENEITGFYQITYLIIRCQF